jgi:hypothetical protein
VAQGVGLEFNPNTVKERKEGRRERRKEGGKEGKKEGRKERKRKYRPHPAQ